MSSHGRRRFGGAGSSCGTRSRVWYIATVESAIGMPIYEQSWSRLRCVVSLAVRQ
jgi:hypothetical protein